MRVKVKQEVSDVVRNSCGQFMDLYVAIVITSMLVFKPVVAKEQVDMMKYKTALKIPIKELNKLTFIILRM